MKKKIITLICISLLSSALISGCSGQDTEKTADKKEAVTSQQSKKAALEDGVYSAEFHTDSGMFHVNEAHDGKGTLTVKDGEMTIHISLVSKNILNLFPGLAEDAKKEGAKVLEPTTDTVTYSDGYTEEVYGFDVPVPELEKEFDLALIGKKGKWYDHKVSVSNPVKVEEENENGTSSNSEPVSVDMEDGEYEVEVTLEGGSGRASVSSPAVLLVKNRKAYARIEWSSPNYDYMKIGTEIYYPVNTEGNSTFEIPVSVFDKKMTVIADTTAMGTPHEIEYTLTFHLE
ncbi:hypothetical protein [Sellimonas caecigallum]|uniref:Iron transporter n=1 Tax=Sellimonas caecigallum TaxID=2592333 RepID=A0ABS7L8D2_9FIRM|nr:hypothetical protein [Sellimonas caecigallum]MBY0759050.1 hypothetical protein [Sellimonas caecigallum]